VTDGGRHRAIDLARAALVAAGRERDEVAEPARRGDAPTASDVPRPRVHTRIDRARRELGYEPRVSLAEGAARTIAWVRAHGT
jgi:nucleoside-diphosphate-sugar epimerase